MTHRSIDLAIPVGKSDHVFGPADASVTLVEYGDYECPFCGEAFPILQTVLRQLPQIRFVFRHFPLTTAHPHAGHAAETAEAAGAQGRFWEMHDMLYSNQEALEDADLLRYAQALALNQARFVEALEDGRYRSHIEHDFMGGVRSGVNGTPSFFINGYRHTGGFDRDSLIRALSSASPPV